MSSVFRCMLTIKKYLKNNCYISSCHSVNSSSFKRWLLIIQIIWFACVTQLTWERPTFSSTVLVLVALHFRHKIANTFRLCAQVDSHDWDLSFGYVYVQNFMYLLYVCVCLWNVLICVFAHKICNDHLPVWWGVFWAFFV